MNERTPAHLFVAIGRALFGDRWKADLAHALEVRVDRIDDWAKGRGKEPPPGVWDELAGMLHDREQAIPALKAAAVALSGLPPARIYKQGNSHFRVEPSADGRFPRVRAINHSGWSQYVDDARRLPDDTRYVVLEFDELSGQPFEVRPDGYVSYPSNMQRLPRDHVPSVVGHYPMSAQGTFPVDTLDRGDGVQRIVTSGPRAR